jgi:predicted anti-sigma-YlaC factor YlaD
VTGMSCARARVLAIDLIDGELSPELEAAVREHVAGCLSCPQLYRALVLVREHLPTLVEAVAGGDVIERVRARFRAAGLQN